jgi:DDE superfamily endonuclease
VIPPDHDPAFVAAMEDVLSVYAQPPDPSRPLVCFDETSKVLTTDVRPSQPARPGHVARQDTEYARNRQEGQANLFLACAPHLGWRHVSVTPSRTAIEVAHALRALVDVHFPHAERIVLVTDHLNVHSPASLYRAFPPAEARRIASRLEWHYTPTHGSWLNMAEVELSVLSRQCLRRRVFDRPTLHAAAAAWVAVRNEAATRILWRFTLELARVRLAHVYPEL